MRLRVREWVMLVYLLWPPKSVTLLIRFAWVASPSPYCVIVGRCVRIPLLKFVCVTSATSVSLPTMDLPLFLSFSFLVVLFQCPSLCLSQTTAEPEVCTSYDGLRTYNCTSRQCLTCFDSIAGSRKSTGARSTVEGGRGGGE